jgi:hypothetical protein
MPDHRIPIRRNKDYSAVFLYNAEGLGKNPANVGDVLCDLRAYDDIERSIGMG